MPPARDPHPIRRRRTPTLGCVVAALLAVAGCRLLPAAGPPSRQAAVGHYADLPPAPADSFTVVSYNIQYGEDLPVALADLQAAPRLRHADAYLLQEMDAAGTDSLARWLGCNYVYHRASTNPRHDRGFGNAVLARWPIVGHGMVVLPHDAPLTGQPRIAVAADLDVDGRHVRLVSVHLATMVVGIDARVDQAATALDSLGVIDAPLIVGGDVNTVSTYEASRLRRIFRRHGLREAPLPAGVTASRRLLGLVAFGMRLDHLYYRGVVPVATGIATGARASDHLPIWATFALDTAATR